MTKKELEKENLYLRAFIRWKNPEVLFFETEEGEKIYLEDIDDIPRTRKVNIKVFLDPWRH